MSRQGKGKYKQRPQMEVVYVVKESKQEKEPSINQTSIEKTEQVTSNNTEKRQQQNQRQQQNSGKYNEKQERNNLEEKRQTNKKYDRTDNYERGDKYERQERRSDPYERNEKYDNRKYKQRENDSFKPRQQQQQKRIEKIDDDYKRELLSDDQFQTEESIEHFDLQKVQTKELTEVLTKLFKQKKVECPICYVRIHYEARIWNCKQCFSPYHLGCIQKWIKNTNATQNNIVYTWSCPKCNQPYQEELPEYFCFCGQEKNPENDRYLVPHSCGGTCNKKRGKFCTHPCPMQCHPGPCPECTVKGIAISCYCGKNRKQTQCSEDKENFSCQQICGKVLNCQKHYCQKSCHPGSCNQCQVKEIITCFCQSVQKELFCGESRFSCNKPCGKTMDCGNHICQSQQCHEQCPPCLNKPELVSRCPCGKYSIETLQPQKRTTCLDPIPSCGQPEERILQCGHKIRSICGMPAQKCNQKVMQICRCKANQQLVQCWEAQEQPQFLCEKVCKKMKSCQVHRCGKECCPANQGNDTTGLHLCLKVCNKSLPCGNHNCGLYCHIGVCQPCPIVITQPISCPCGKSVKNPPNKCGTKHPECSELCLKDLPNCDHKCQSICHQGLCNNCPMIVEKSCRCGKAIIPSQCSKQPLCQNKCLKPLKCGHICQDVCPLPGPCTSDQLGHCNQRCGKKLPCFHPCSTECHFGSDCPKEPCKTQVRIRCECNNREAYVDCGVIDVPIEKILKCDAKCANLKRFGNFINSSSKMVDQKKVYFPSILFKFTHYNLNYLQKLEEKLEDFLINSENDSIDFNIGKSDWVELKKNALWILLSKHYKFDVQFQRLHKGGYIFTVYKSNDTILIKPKLSEFFLQLQKGQFQKETFPFEAKLRTLAPLTKTEIDQIETQINEYKEHYYLEKRQGSWEFYFWELSHAEEVQRRVKKVIGFGQIQWILEANNQVLDEKDKLTIKSQNDVIVKYQDNQLFQQQEESKEGQEIQIQDDQIQETKIDNNNDDDEWYQS